MENLKLSERFMYYSGLLVGMQGAGIVDDLKHILDLLDAEEQGLLLRLPCRVGDEVYYVYTKCNADGTECYKHCENCDWFSIGIERVAFDLDMLCGFGEFYFLTKAEAEKKLAEMGCE